MGISAEIEYLREVQDSIQNFLADCDFLSEEDKKRLSRLLLDMSAGDLDTVDDDRSRQLRLEVELSWLLANAEYAVSTATRAMEQRRADIVLPLRADGKPPAAHIIDSMVVGDAIYNEWASQKEKRQLLNKLLTQLSWALRSRMEVIKELSEKQSTRFGQG